MLKKITTLTVMMLCMSLQMHSMNLPGGGAPRMPNRTEEDFDNYLQHGDPFADEIPTTNRDLAIIRADIQNYRRYQQTASDPKEYWTQFLTKFRAQIPLRQVSWDEVTDASYRYEGHFQILVHLYAYKQRLLQRILKKEEGDNSDQLWQDIKVLDHKIMISSQCITMVRSSGLEHDLLWGATKKTWVREPLWGLFTTEYRIKRMALRQIHDLYIRRLPFRRGMTADGTMEEPIPHEYPCNTLNPTNMATIRHHLYHGVEGVQYETTTAYRGPAICRLKFRGEEPCNWSYAEFVARLGLTDEEAGTTDKKKNAKNATQEETSDLDTRIKKLKIDDDSDDSQ